MITVSACLCGVNCRYDGRNSYHNALMEKLASEDFLPVCPEVLGGLSVPRTPARIIGGTGYDVLKGTARVINDKGRDVTGAFLKGAFAVLAILQEHSVSRCYVKDKSPSCGFGKGSLTDNRITGVCSALLDQKGIQVIEIPSEK